MLADHVTTLRWAVVLVPCSLAVGPWAPPSARRETAASFAVSGTAFKVHAEEITADGVSSFPSSIGSSRDAKPTLPTAVKDDTEEIFPEPGESAEGA
ncbi:hypothetical protein [Streptomyces sp. M2CJ-2]|uniref:hypothetical protein n=1 Tax=Streptomyces sp. M2CJ-2 TaxID=2803948 RepID=UPI001F310D2A|nr:hypothetical protein [Streptomyces sp. M2CJ-2]